MIKFAVEKRWSSEVAFTAEIDCAEDTPRSWKLRLAVEWAIKSKANLSEANLSEADLSKANLSKANLSWANLSKANLSEADLSEADLSEANLSKANLSEADLSEADLSEADLSEADLSWADLSKADLSEADLSWANLSEADLSKANLSKADLSEANLSWANLSKANLSEANLSAIPKIEKIHQTVYEAASKPDALNMRDWHTCETTHCRAGWVVTLAGAAGKALEFGLGTNAAAALIYLASDPEMKKIPHWTATNTDALEDMKRLADEESARAA